MTAVLLLYLTADYCDPSVPGVFFFDSESFFMESVEAKTPVSFAAPSRPASPLPVPRPVETPTIRSTALARASVVRAPYFPRMHLAASHPRSPVDPAEDH